MSPPRLVIRKCATPEDFARVAAELRRYGEGEMLEQRGVDAFLVFVDAYMQTRCIKCAGTSGPWLLRQGGAGLCASCVDERGTWASAIASVVHEQHADIQRVDQEPDEGDGDEFGADGKPNRYRA